ncbi:coenzyme PQQ synthesis protein E [Lachnospiraceae bacterium]|nr:coenzyme PQQ synthesis protein E [Lachnospiraceae bacterium]
MDERQYKERILNFRETEGSKLYPEYPLKGLHIELSNICNHQCLFCANRKMSRKKGFMDESFLKRILQEAYDEGFREVGYYANGEPFVSPDLDKYIEWAKKTGYSYVYIDTNGGTDFYKIKKAIDAGLDSIKFSINGTDPENYKLIHGRNDFDRVMENLKRTCDYKKSLNRPLNVYVSIAVTKYIENSVDKFAEYCRQYCDDLVTNSVIEMGGYIGEELKYLQTQKNMDFNHGMTIPCYLLWNSLFITYEGYATACCADFQNYLVYADLNQTSLKDAWNNEVITNLRRAHLEGNIDGLPCITCAYGKKAEWHPLIDKYVSVCNPDIFSGYDIEKRIDEYEKHLIEKESSI